MANPQGIVGFPISRQNGPPWRRGRAWPMSCSANLPLRMSVSRRNGFHQKPGAFKGSRSDKNLWNQTCGCSVTLGSDQSIRNNPQELLDLPLMQINLDSSNSRDRKELLQADLVCPRPMMLDARKNWSAVDGCRYILIAMSNKLPRAMRDSASAQS